MGKKGKTKLKLTSHPEVRGFFCLALSLFTLLAFGSFSFQDPQANWLGYAGYLCALWTHTLFGLASYLIPLYALWQSLRFLRKEKTPFLLSEHLYFLLLLSSASMLLAIWAIESPSQAAYFEGKVVAELLSFSQARPFVRYHLGGVPFSFLFNDLPWLNLKKVLSPIGTGLIFSSLALVCLLAMTQWSLVQAIYRLFQGILYLLRNLRKGVFSLFRSIPLTPSPVKISPRVVKEEKKVPLSPPQKLSQILTQPKPSIQADTPPSVDPTPTIKITTSPPTKESKAAPLLPAKGGYSLPPPDLLSSPEPNVDPENLKKDLLRQAAVLEETLKSFGIEAKVGEIHSGPTITSFEVHPSIGVKVQRIKALENDIALNMQAKSIRIVAPIPGKAAVGVEVPARHPQEVSFKEMLQYYQTRNRKLQIPILLGKAINGEWVIADLAKMPHCLIAGATGSGKSVCVNTIVMSILMNARPENIRMLMIDPKKVELTQYSKLPHMIAPVITEAHGAYAALQWLVKEMQVRYEILKQLGLRNISAFNNRKIQPDLEGSLSIPIPEHMPWIVAIIDEFADLMMVSSADIETPIARIAQMARAVGIHLILATQRPSREVITGIIKANIPTRISFKVASRINSQIILDEIGAESLLGNGDLLFLPPGTSQLLRAQGAYMRDEDINQVIETICKQHPPNYLLPSFDAFRPLEGDKGSESGRDLLYDQALEIVMTSRSASTTFLQRKLKIGYARAASLMDELEQNGVIGPQEGAKARRVIASQQPSLLSEEGDDEELP